MTIPMNCPAAEPLIARYVDDPASVGSAERQELERHLERCEACRVVLQDQRHVARALRARSPVAVSPGFAARLAARLDAEPTGWLGMANWRAWTAMLTPVALALVLFAWLGGSWSIQLAAPSTSEVQADTFDTWPLSSAAAEPAAVFLQSSTGDALLEAVLTGTPAAAGESDAR
jgi:anti-sigma factor RsiW